MVVSSLGESFTNFYIVSFKMLTCCLGTKRFLVISALGFYHMQSTFGRDNYIEINWNNIRKNKTHNFKMYNASTVTNFNITYDFESIMHYRWNSFAKNPNIYTIKPLVSYKLSTVFEP